MLQTNFFNNIYVKANDCSALQKEFFFVYLTLLYTMKKDRIYIDTSIVGGYFDVEFEFETKLLFERLEKKEIIFVISDLMDIELERAPDTVKNLLFNFSNDSFERVNLTKEAQELGQLYVNEKVVGETIIEDCYHIAMATINNVDVLDS